VKQILVVEDDRSVRHVMRLFLEEAGFHVEEAEDFRKARDLLREHEFDLLITDLDLPGGNGLDLVRQARSFRPSLLSILVTGYGCSEVRRQAAEISLIYLEKPFDPDELLDLANGRTACSVADERAVRAATG